MNDYQGLTEVRESLLAEGDALTGVHMNRSAEAVLARGQSLRLRRRLTRGLSGVAAVGGAAAIAVALSTGGTAARPREVHVNLTAWSVNTSHNGTVTLKMRSLSDPRRLEHTLGEAGVPALVRWGELCTAPRSQYLPAGGIVDGPDYVGGIAPPVRIHGESYPNEVWTFTPSRMPPHARYMLTAIPVNRVPAGRGGMTWGLIRDSAHVTCSTDPVAG
ncbi:MAG: hypothetical protein J2P32_16125 [Actinobacteria bacterium]|nr:hypothetical protein [Actinomycetota bacterium]